MEEYAEEQGRKLKIALSETEVAQRIEQLKQSENLIIYLKAQRGAEEYKELTQLATWLADSSEDKPIKKIKKAEQEFE